ncbi:MAG: sigma-70 family RNA polymerase sigma factor [Pseudomonadota bacterium]
MPQASSFAKVEISPNVASRVLRGESAAIAQAYEVMAQAVMNLAYRMLNDRQMAEEVLQDTFIDLLEKYSQIKSPGAISPWVRTVAVNHCLMKLRSPWHARRSAQDADAVFEQHPDMHVQQDSSVSTQDLESALGVLNPDSRAVLWLHDVEGYTHKEIGHLMGKTASFSKSQLARAYGKLMGWRSNPAATNVKKNIENDDENRRSKGTC